MWVLLALLDRQEVSSSNLLRATTRKAPIDYQLITIGAFFFKEAFPASKKTPIIPTISTLFHLNSCKSVENGVHPAKHHNHGKGESHS